MTELNPTISKPCVSACIQGLMTKRYPEPEIDHHKLLMDSITDLNRLRIRATLKLRHYGKLYPLCPQV